MHKQYLTRRTALVFIMMITAITMSACANLPPILGGASAPDPTNPPATIAPPPAQSTTEEPAPPATLTPAPLQPPTETAPPTEAAPLANVAPANAAREALAREVGTKFEDIRVVSVVQVDWPDGCLGIAKPGRMCTQAIVPGYRIILEANGKEYEYRADLSGRQVILATESVRDAAVPAAVFEVRSAAAAELGLGLQSVRIVAVEKVDWPDPCLGIPDPLELCAQVITPGYRIVLDANGQQVIYHTDETGQNFRRERQPGVETPNPQNSGQPGAGGAASGPIVGLRTVTDGCFEVRIDLNGIAFGGCGEEMASAPFTAGANRLEQLADMQRTYNSFGASTPAGKVTFAGKGRIEPTPVEQRMIAEWANLVAQEVQAGSGEARHGLVWHREGGIAGFCDELTVEVGGHAVLQSCKDAPETAPGWWRLTSSELTAFYGWIDQMGQLSFEQKDAAVADAMTIRGLLAGRGASAGTAADKAAVLQFVSDLLAQWAEATPVQIVDTVEMVNLRQGPGEQFEVMETIAAGQQVLVTGVNRDSTWWRVICPDDTVGNCWISADATLTRPIAPAGSTGEAPIDETGILTAVIRQVYTVDDTFGGQGNFTTVYLLAVDDAETGAIPYNSKARSVPAPVQQGILAALTDLSSQFKWIASAGEAPRDEENIVQGNGAIITIGNIHVQDDGTVHIAASIYVGMLAAGGQTYVLERHDGAWKITGTTGMSWIS